MKKHQDSYRQKAAKVRRQARREQNVSTRLDLELLATGYDRLAAQAQVRHPDQRSARGRSRSH
jgi:hypothetical protein